MVNQWPKATIGVHSLSFAALSSSLREGAGRGWFHSSNRPEIRRLRAIFIAPTKALNVLHFTLHPGDFETVAGRGQGATKKMFTDTVGLWYDMAKGTETEGSCNEFYCPGYGMESALARLAVV